MINKVSGDVLIGVFLPGGVRVWKPSCWPVKQAVPKRLADLIHVMSGPALSGVVGIGFRDFVNQYEMAVPLVCQVFRII